VLLFAVCAAPVIGAYLAYYFWHPSAQVNYGELIEPRPLPDTPLARVDGSPFGMSQLKGEWVLVVADTAACAEACRTKLVYTRQVRLAQGKDTARIERVWLVTDGGSPDPALLAEQPGLVVVRAAGSDVLGALPAKGSPAAHIYVVDPLGNLMMRYPDTADPRRMLKDLARLLRHSKWK
jgi:cytochrome oxidase Cu insertion factor (SCO1/SenC/PrrC family)